MRWTSDHKNQQIFFCFIPIEIIQRFLGSKVGSKFWWLPWCPAKNYPHQTFLPRVHIFIFCFLLFRVMDHRILQVMDYVFVIGMGAEIWLRVLAEGLLFTPKAVVKDTAGILDISMFIVSLIWVCWMPKVVAPHSLAQILMLLRCFRPLRQELLNIWTWTLNVTHHLGSQK